MVQLLQNSGCSKIFRSLRRSPLPSTHKLGKWATCKEGKGLDIQTLLAERGWKTMGVSHIHQDRKGDKTSETPNAQADTYPASCKGTWKHKPLQWKPSVLEQKAHGPSPHG